ncbi:hypothetical protein EXM22_04295 [Oceanispirochaeta crateris]|uniref:SbsA Ig-like domain-containing protein n=1 Tax=Oceanispirochaeta crateris TaxID=2518645 RepID=A0A5C1QGK5_9SPIO|nr:Ig-like domain-containing protein [Oceanispirochaeta crateris]QEN07243.1 hypothetical protein EXM22_04295 [Oceanispirochaeta crateris]
MKGRWLTICFLALVSMGCKLVDLTQQQDFISSPSKEYEVLPGGSPVSIIFTRGVDHYSVENIVSIKDYEGKLDIRFQWKDEKTLWIEPLSEPVSGLEYRLEIIGFYRFSNGKTAESKCSLPFYWDKKELTPLRVLSVHPSSGVLGSEETEIGILFSSKVEDSTLLRGFSISPNTKVETTWSEQTLLVSPREKWENLETYTLRFSKDVEDQDGNPLLAGYEHSFFAQYGTDIPSVMSVGSCSRDLSGGFESLEADLTNLAVDQALRIRFSQAMDHISTENALSLSPSLAGDFFWQEDPQRPGIEDLIFLPEDRFVMSQSYRLGLATSARGNTGIQMTSDFILIFTPNLEELALTCMECLSYGGFSLNDFSSDTSYDLPAGPVSPFSLTFRFTFSRPFISDREKQEVQNSLKIYEIFSSGGSPQAGLFSWSSDYSMTVLFNGFNADNEQEYYYMIELPGGEGGIINDEGSFLPSPVRQLFRIGPL